MAEKLDEREAVNPARTSHAPSTPVGCCHRVLIKEGVITESELFRELKQLQAEYEKRNSANLKIEYETDEVLLNEVVLEDEEWVTKAKNDKLLLRGCGKLPL